MKKKMLFCLLLVLFAALMFLPAQASAASDTLTVQTRSGEYTFRVGESFTYDYWLDLSADALTKVGYFDSDTLQSLKSAVLESVSGNIMFDTSHLELVDGSMPNFHLGIVRQKSDLLDGSLLDGTVLDFTNGDLFFKPIGINSDESVLFREKNILVRVKFKVTAGCDTPVYLRTKLHKLDVSFGSKTISFIDNKNSIAIVPFASYESINGASPDLLLSPYVSDQAFDIRCFRTPSDTEHYLRPGAGVAVTFNGVSYTVEQTSFTQHSTGEDVFWFYDVPYGEYFVSCSYTSENGTKYETPKLSQGEYVSIPSTGIVQALWLFEADPQQDDTESAPGTFEDVPESSYCYDAVQWAAENGVTNGTDETHFSPDASCTRAQMVTFLWRAAGCPKAGGKTPFIDVAADSYYGEAVAWAYEKGITKGTSETTFSPDATVTRAQVVTFLYRYEEAAANTKINPFSDVSENAYYYDAVLWAYGNGITKGTSETTFSPDAVCTRGQIVTFLYRDFAVE